MGVLSLAWSTPTRTAMKCTIPSTLRTTATEVFRLPVTNGQIKAKADSLPVEHWPQALPFQQFQVLLTLFSKFFSSFPHGTCSLSVSHRLFSFRWSLPPFLGCTPKQPDSLRLQQLEDIIRVTYGIVTLCDTSFQKDLYPNISPDSSSQDYNSERPLATQILGLSYSRFTRRY